MPIRQTRVMSSNQIRENAAQTFHALDGVQRARRGMIDPTQRGFDVSVIAGGGADIALKSGAILTKIVPQPRQLGPVACVEGGSERLGQCRHATQMLIEQMR